MDDSNMTPISDMQREELKKKAVTDVAKIKSEIKISSAGAVESESSEAMVNSEASEPEVLEKLLDSGFHDNNGAANGGASSSAETSSGSDSSGVSTEGTPRTAVKYKYSREELIRLRHHPLSLRDPDFTNDTSDAFPVLRRRPSFFSNHPHGSPPVPMHYSMEPQMPPMKPMYMGGGGGGLPHSSPFMGFSLPEPPNLLPNLNDEGLFPSPPTPMMLPPIPIPPHGASRHPHPPPPPPMPPFPHFRDSMGDYFYPPVITPPPPPSTTMMLGDGLLPTPGPHSSSPPWELGRRMGGASRFGGVGPPNVGAGLGIVSVPNGRGGAGMSAGESGRKEEQRFGSLSSRGRPDQQMYVPPRRSAGGASGPPPSYQGGNGRNRFENRGGGYGRDREEEPEWFSEGPMSQTDFIELGGLEEIEERRDEDGTSSKGNVPPRGEKKSEGKVPPETSGSTAPSQGLNPAAPEFDIGDFLDLGDLPTTDIVRTDIPATGPSTSRFSKFFDRTTESDGGKAESHSRGGSGEPGQHPSSSPPSRPKHAPPQPSHPPPSASGNELLDFVNRAQQKDFDRREILVRFGIKPDVIFCHQAQAIIKGILLGTFQKHHLLEQLDGKALPMPQREIVSSLLFLMNSNVPIDLFQVHNGAPPPPASQEMGGQGLDKHSASLLHQQHLLRAASSVVQQHPQPGFRSSSPPGGNRPAFPPGRPGDMQLLQHQAAAAARLKDQQMMRAAEEMLRRQQQQDRSMSPSHGGAAGGVGGPKLFGSSHPFTPVSVLRKMTSTSSVGGTMEKEKELAAQLRAMKMPGSSSGPHQQRGGGSFSGMGEDMGGSDPPALSMDMLFENVQRMQREQGERPPPLPRSMALSVDEVERQQAAVRAAAGRAAVLGRDH